MAQSIMPAIGRDFYIEHGVVAHGIDAVYLKRMKGKRITKYLGAW